MANKVARAAAERARAEYLEQHGYEAACRAASDALAAVIAARDTAPAHEWDGKRVFKMRNVGGMWEHRLERVEGIVETRRSTARFPANTANFSKPRLGEGFVRYCKKDGKPGARFDSLRCWELA